MYMTFRIFYETTQVSWVDDNVMILPQINYLGVFYASNASYDACGIQ